MNTYKKFCANVFVAKCCKSYKKGDIAVITTQNGKNHEVIIYNLVQKSSEFYYYSFVRSDGFNTQKFAKQRSDLYEKAAMSAEKRSCEFWEKSRESAEFLALGEPVKVGHHSEKKHRALIERNCNRISKAIEESEKSEVYQQKAAHWKGRTEDINLSMPESLAYFKEKLDSAKNYHAGLKDGSIEREHSFSLQYANKALKDIQKKYEIAKILWGDKNHEQ